MISELRELMRSIGIEDQVARDFNPGRALAGNAMDSADYPAFLDAIEQRFGICVDDRYALRLKTLNDFNRFVRERTGKKPSE